MESKVDASERVHIHFAHAIDLAERVSGKYDWRTIHVDKW
jgi:hypothetical protein